MSPMMDVGNEPDVSKMNIKIAIGIHNSTLEFKT